MKQKLVVIGNGMVGHNFLENLMASNIKDNYEVITFCEESLVAYDRVHLSEYFSGKSASDLSLVEENFFEDNGITLHIGDKAVAIDRDKKIVTSAKGVSIEYDKIVLATGSTAFVPPIKGNDRENCIAYRTIDDLDLMLEAAKTSKVGVVVGGGLLGLEAAKALRDLNLDTHVVQFGPYLMSAQLDQGGADLLKEKIEALGVSVWVNKNTVEITDGENCKHKMKFADGGELEADMILYSAGIRPRYELAEAAGLEIAPRGGVVIDNHCLTSDADIYAIGECASWNNQTFGLVAPGYSMARTVVDHLAGGEQRFLGADMSTKLKLNGVDVASIGDPHGVTPGSLIYTYQNGVDGIYKRLVVSADNKKLLGAVLVGDASGYPTLHQYYLNAIDLPANPDSLIIPSRSDESVGLGPDALPMTAQICSCYDVSKGDVCEAIEGGCHTIGALKESTQAATGCGGCAALLKSVLDCELEKAGLEVNTDICEHFKYTRQDLYNIIMVEEIKTFSDLISKHGSGRGCEICKQAVGSILASYWNDYILDNNHLGLQDTNDTYLANMQKDGTYSVVPRMTGGEVSPEGLIAIG
jgi:nitrite reductase (NADH) large subunit